jgi:PPOX class probable F420-dependent enzyme
MKKRPKLPKVVQGLVDGKNFAFLATVMPDGSPQVTPVWVDREGGTILVNTVKGRTKQKNMSRDPRVALAIVDWKEPYTWAQIRGRVVQQTTKNAGEHIDRLAKKYLGLKKYPWSDKKRTIARIVPGKIVWEKEG